MKFLQSMSADARIGKYVYQEQPSNDIDIRVEGKSSGVHLKEFAEKVEAEKSSADSKYALFAEVSLDNLQKNPKSLTKEQATAILRYASSTGQVIARRSTAKRAFYIPGLSKKATHLSDNSINSARVTTLGVQAILTELGYKPGPIDGFFGRKTEAALVQYQMDKKIQVDGDAGSQIFDHLVADYEGGAVETAEQPSPGASMRISAHNAGENVTATRASGSLRTNRGE